VIAAILLLLPLFTLSSQKTFAASYAARGVQTGAVTHRQVTAPAPFLHRPYYGTSTISSRTVSFFDHDHPWYDNDGTFVRYDGAKWTNVSLGSCIGGVNCYDGHNGYDLNMWYEPVLSAAAGTVIRAGWYNPLDHNNSYGLWVAIDHGNGIATAYGHLSAITVAVGDQVGVQWQIGTSGTTGSSTGPHLHMATYYLPNWQATDPFGWSGNYTDPNVVPDNYLWVNDPATTYPVPTLSSNGSAVYPGATMVDDSSSGWSSTGSWTSDSNTTDIGGSLHWAWTTTGSATATATWQPTLHADGYYEVGVFVNDNHASSSWVSYTIYSNDPNHDGTTISHTVSVDESHIGTFQGPFNQENTGPQWIGLGTYNFKSSMSGRVVLNNATGESSQQISADGVEFVPVSVQATPPPPTYGFSITSDGTHATTLPGGTMKSTLTIKNTSNFSWFNSGSSAVQLLYRWINARGQTVTTSSPITLPQSTNVGSTMTLTVTIQAPTAQGSYTLQWDMEQSSLIFSQHGAQVKNDGVQVTPSKNIVSPPRWRPLGIRR
jgi:murein DD-endopeptidase MepM/ murein hydrolase activator NlpD